MTERLVMTLNATWYALLEAWALKAKSAHFAALQVFALRATSAAVLFISQIALARWMGAGEYGIYVSAWTCVLVLGGLSHLGLAVTSMRLAPEYRANGSFELLRGLLKGTRVLGLLSASAIALVVGAALKVAGYDMSLTSPMTLALLCLPLYAWTDVQDGLGRGSGWTFEAIAPPYVLRPLILLVVIGLLHLAHFDTTASYAMLAALIATVATSIVQTRLIEKRIGESVPAGPAHYEFAAWLKISLPLLAVGTCEVIMQNADVLILNMYRPSHEIGIYYAASKTTALTLFVQYAIGSAYAGRIAAAGATANDREVNALVRQAVRWTFYPSAAVTLAVILLGYPLLAQFGEGFADAYPLIFILAVGMLARSAMGPSDMILNMLGQHRACAISYAIAAATCVILQLVLIPLWGVYGASVASAAAFVTMAVLNWYAARKKLGINIFVLAHGLPWTR